MMRSVELAAALLVCAALGMGCNQDRNNSEGMEGHRMPSTMPAGGGMHEMHQQGHHDMQSRMMAGEKTAVAIIRPSKAAATQPVNNNVTGTVTFTQVGDKVKVVADIDGLEPNTTHGFHIHEKGDLTAPDLMSTGGHYNPEKHVHGGPATSPVHAGDMGNITADANGHAHLELMLDDISVGGAKNDIVGKAVMVHGKEDDLKSQPAGNAGPRVAGGVIEMK